MASETNDIKNGLWVPGGQNQARDFRGPISPRKPKALLEVMRSKREYLGESSRGQFTGRNVTERWDARFVSLIGATGTDGSHGLFPIAQRGMKGENLRR